MEFCRPCKRVKLAVSDESIYWCYYNHAICVGQWKAEEAGGKGGRGEGLSLGEGGSDAGSRWMKARLQLSKLFEDNWRYVVPSCPRFHATVERHQGPTFAVLDVVQSSGQYK